MQELALDLADDHVIDEAKLKKPLDAVIELIWNALDSDATHVTVTVATNEIEHPERITVVDNGTGMTNEVARREFKVVGNSWKKLFARTPRRNVEMHGAHGKGRLRAFALGRRSRWVTVAENENSERERTVIEIDAAAPTRFTISDPEPAGDEAVGTRFETSSPQESTTDLLAPDAYGQIVQTFALRLMDDPEVEITYCGRRVDTESILNETGDKSFEIPVPAEVSEFGPARLRVLEWTENVGRTRIALCGKGGLALGQVTPGMRVPSDLHLSAYLLWDGFTQNPDALDLAPDAHEVTSDVIEAARSQFRIHVTDIAKRRQGMFIQELKAEQSYPWEGEPQSKTEELTRNTFDVVAVVTRQGLPSDPKKKRFTLGMLRHTLETVPDALPAILQQLLALTPDQHEDLAAILTRTTIPSIVSATRTVADREAFLIALRIIVSEPEVAETTTERDHLHRIIEREPWIFGEHLALTVSEVGLTKALQRHVALLGRNELAPAPIRDSDGKVRRVDLMLSGAFRDTRTREHLVVELKRPSLKVGAEELSQVSRYAKALVSDQAFSDDTRWEFWLVTHRIDESVTDLIRQEGRPYGVYVDKGQYRIWVKTWGEIIEAAEQRLAFYRDELEIRTSEDDALEYIRRAHAEHLPPAFNTQPDV